MRLSSHLSFRVAVNLLADFFGVVISRETARQLSEGVGQRYAEYQNREVERIEREMPPVGEKSSHLQVSVDGAMVSLVGGEWAEVKTMAIGVVDCSLNEQDEVVRQCHQLSYFSRLAEAQEFGKQALVETHRRGLSESAKVSAVLDGAEWLQGFVDLHCPKATRILDFPHAAQRLSGIGEAIWGKGRAEAKNWLSDRLHQLKQNGASDLLVELEQLQLSQPEQPLLLENLNYLKKRQSQLEYGQFRAQGHPIGSGIVESANKLVVQARLKGPGMHWQRANINGMLALRNLECNGRWSQGWEELEQLKQKSRFDKREARRSLVVCEPVAAQACEPRPSGDVGRSGAELAEPILAQACEPILSLAASSPKQAEAKAAYNGKPAADHPWRKAKIGRAKFSLAKAS